MMSAKAGKRPLRSLTAHEKLEAIRRVHDGESKASVARDIGVPESTLRGWCKNEEKISYISRQSSPETDDSIHGAFEPKEKKLKLDDSISPFNLSLKPSRVSYSPNSEIKYPMDFSKVVEDKALNLNVKTETPKSQMSERERNRAELARLSIELGLNRPEMYGSVAGINPQVAQQPVANNLGDLSSNIGLLSQWNNLLMQQQKQVNQKKVTAPAPADTSSNIITSSSSLLTTYKPEMKIAEKSPKLPKVDPPKSVEDSVWYWLKTQQAMLGLSQNQPNLNMPSSTNGNGLNSIPSSTSNDQNSSWFWKWYKQYTQVSQQLQQQQQLHNNTATDNKLLYQQLTKEIKDPSNSENLKVEEKPKITNNKARAVLDNLLLNNNNNVAMNKKEGRDEDLSQIEALEHGEKFLKWLECCSEPSVTAMQIMQFRGLITNIKTGVERKNGDLQKAKVKRK